MSDTKSPLENRPDYVVCTCMGVMYSEIIEAIKSGHTTFDQLSELLMVGTGCNSCVQEVHDIIAEQVGQ